LSQLAVAYMCRVCRRAMLQVPASDCDGRESVTTALCSDLRSTSSLRVLLTSLGNRTYSRSAAVHRQYGRRLAQCYDAVLH